jgi:hypothetical protein
LTVLEGQQERTELEKEYYYPPTTPVMLVVLTSQWNFFFLFFVLINYTDNSRCMVTPIGISFNTVTTIGKPQEILLLVLHHKPKQKGLHTGPSMTVDEAVSSSFSSPQQMQSGG